MLWRCMSGVNKVVGFVGSSHSVQVSYGFGDIWSQVISDSFVLISFEVGVGFSR